MANFRTKARAIDLLGKKKLQIYQHQYANFGKMAMMHMVTDTRALLIKNVFRCAHYW